MSIKFDSGGEKNLFVTYTQTNNSTCAQGKTNVINLKVFDRTVITPPEIALEAGSDKWELGATLTITAEINGIYNSDGSDNDDERVLHIYIDGVDKQTCRFNFSTKCEYIWDTTASLSTVGTKTVVAKLFTSAGVYTPPDKQMLITLCPVGGLATCVATTPTAGGTTTDDTPKVSLEQNASANVGGQLLSFVLNRGSGINGLINFIINLLLSLIGAFAFISFLVAGIQYITAGGDSAKAGKAKKTMIYAGVSMIIAIFSLVILHLVNNEIVKL